MPPARPGVLWFLALSPSLTRDKIREKGSVLILLDKETRHALDSISAAQPDCPRNSYSYPYLCEILALDENDMFPVVKNLVVKGLAEYAYAVSSQNRRDVGIALKQDGLKYKELNRLERRERWKERFIGAGVTILVWALQELIKYLPVI